MLATQRVGQVAVCGARPEIVPVLYALLDGDVVFRTAPGEKLLAAALYRTVAFEIDAFDVDTRQGWASTSSVKREEIRHADERTPKRSISNPGPARHVTDTCASARHVMGGGSQPPAELTVDHMLGRRSLRSRPSSLGDETAVDGDRLAGNEARAVGAEPHDRVGDLVSCPDAAHWLDAVRSVSAAGSPCVNRATMSVSATPGRPHSRGCHESQSSAAVFVSPMTPCLEAT